MDGVGRGKPNATGAKAQSIVGAKERGSNWYDFEEASWPAGEFALHPTEVVECIMETPVEVDAVLRLEGG
jgi:hypothetical protein